MQEEQKTGKNFVGKTAKAIGGGVKKTVATIKMGSEKCIEKIQVAEKEALLKRYNPLFPEAYTDSNFAIPNVIVIVDDAVRKGIEVCKGAIGWISKEKGVEILHLYDEAIEFSGLKFVPTATCDTVYYVDAHNRKKFIQLDNYFNYTHEERLAELQHIAFCLGAKRYSVDVVESKRRKTKTQTKTELDASCKKIKGQISAETEVSSGYDISMMAGAKASFHGEREVVMPNLLWFAGDNNILNLIAMRCSSNDSSGLSEYNMEIRSANSASMSLSVAAKINAAIWGMGIKLSCDIKQMSEEEHNRTLIYKLEF